MHHSTGDWDISGTWDLDTSIYVSSPSSFHSNLVGVAFIKTSVVPIADVKEGRVETEVRNDHWGNYILIMFRYQDSDNYYYVKYWWSATTDYTIFQIHRVKAGVDTTLKTATKLYGALNTWQKTRVTWWNDYVGLVIRFEYWNGSAWVKGCDDAYDSNNYWEDVGGRICLWLESGGSSYDLYVDDTKIYGVS